MKKIIFFFLIFFVFNVIHVNSNSDKNLYYSKSDLYSNRYYTLYFTNMNSDILREKLKVINCDIYSYIIDGKKYYARDIDNLIENHFNGYSIEDKLKYNNIIRIDGINIFCNINELIKFKNIAGIY